MLDRLIGFPIFLIALVVHELSHGLAADKLGDPTPRVQGRLTLNPLKHLDPIGTLLFLVSGFGWAKPVEYDPYNLQSPRKDGGLIALAGPISNFALALLAALLLRILPISQIVAMILIQFIVINLSLAIFNLVPVHPLDGEKILLALLPRDLAFEFASIMNRYGSIILILLVLPLFGPSPISSLISPAISFFANLLIP